MPDIARDDTLQVLKRFSTNERKQLTREISREYQLESQKAHWAESADGRCLFCQQPDSHAHRLLHCPTVADTRSSHVATLRKMEESGAEFDKLPAITVHPEAAMHRVLHFRQPAPVITQFFKQFAADMCSGQSIPYIYIYILDGSCAHPTSPTTRYAAYAGVMDMARDDNHRRWLAEQFRATGIVPYTLRPCFAGRVIGEQTINRAELSALIQAAMFPQAMLHTDSQYALSRAPHHFACYSVGSSQGSQNSGPPGPIWYQ